MKINTNSPEEAAETIYNTLTRQRFADWYSYNGNFGNHIAGDLNCYTKEQIIEDIKQLFKINRD